MALKGFVNVKISDAPTPHQPLPFYVKNLTPPYFWESFGT